MLAPKQSFAASELERSRDDDACKVSERKFLTRGEEIAPLRHSVELDAKAERALTAEVVRLESTLSPFGRFSFASFATAFLRLPDRLVIAVRSDPILTTGLCRPSA